MMSANQHLTCNIDKSIKQAVKKKITDYDRLYIKDCVEAGLILILDKSEDQIRNIIEKYSNKEVKK